MALEGGPGLISFDGGALACDMLLDASAVHSLQLTQYPIETGSTISDHAVFQPFQLDITLIQSDTPISPIPNEFTVQTQQLSAANRPQGRQSNELKVRQSDAIPVNVNQLIGAVSSRIVGAAAPIRIDGLKSDEPVGTVPFSVSVLSANAPAERVNQFYADLLSLMLGVTPLNISFKGVTHIDMVIVNLTRTDAPGQVGAARFQVSLQRVATVSTQTVELPPVPEATRKQSRGKKDGKKATPEETESIANKLFDKGISVTDSVVNLFSP